MSSTKVYFAFFLINLIKRLKGRNKSLTQYANWRLEVVLAPVLVLILVVVVVVIVSREKNATKTRPAALLADRVIKMEAPKPLASV